MFDTPSTEKVFMSDTLSRDDTERLLAENRALLGPCTPLPRLYEEALRAWRKLPVGSARFVQADALLARLPHEHLLDIIADTGAAVTHRLLAACLLALPAAAQVAVSPVPAAADEGMRMPHALVAMMRPGDAWQADLPPSPADDEALPHPRALLAFLARLQAGTLTEPAFRHFVMREHVLHPLVARHHPLRHLNRLLDYLGFTGDAWLHGAFRRLAAQLWPTASAENWASWQWITCPGGPELFPCTARALAAGEVTLPRLYELKYAPLLDPAAINALLDSLDPAIIMLACWLRADIDPLTACRPLLRESVRWMTSSNTRAADEAYCGAAWWPEWLSQGYPAAGKALSWLQQVALPPGVTARHGWLAEYLMPAYRTICHNLLLAHVAAGGPTTEMLALAAEEDLPAIRALGLAPVDDAVITRLTELTTSGGRPARVAATNALDHLARRVGLPGGAEFAAHHLLALAWEPNPLHEERVRVGWACGAYRIRLCVRHGAITLEVLAPHGPVTRIPNELRHSEAYREAREAQREAQTQYRRFKEHLERAMVDGAPLILHRFRHLYHHPLFAHLAERLVWRTPTGETVLWSGPERWETCEGSVVALDDGFTLTLVHPLTLAREGALMAWQLLAADRRLQQPFKQLFREVYPGDGEIGTECLRFAGRRVDPRRAYALLRAAGFAPGTGIARREWPGGITAHLCWAEGVRGRDLFGPHRLAEVVTGAISFTKDGAPLPLHRVNAIWFSETLRAADLLTTQAAMGDVDLTSRETLALRATMLRQIARSFRLTNIAVPEDGRYAVVLGTRATYRVNLASGTVLLEPEGKQVLLPPADPRWLPIEDRDTGTDILATILVLAHDGEITDLTFLAQL